MQTSYGLSRDEIFNVSSDASAAIKEACGASNLYAGGRPDCRDSGYWTSLVGTTITYDKRNNPTNPTSGYFLQAGTDFAGLGGDAQYWRVNAEARGYYPITDKITFVARAIGGTIQGWGGEDVRLLDSFFKGGETVRGFDRAGYGPRDLNTNDALGGQTYWATTAEVRFPLPFVPEDMGLSGAFFADAGSLFDATGGAVAALSAPGCIENGKPCQLADSSSIRSSVGASIMWNSPVGPIRMDFAKVLTKQAYDETQFFRFGASSRF
jgi:outer membrane protein insertion porin family